MRSRLRIFVLVGVAATAVDIGLMLALQPIGLVQSDVVALLVAAVFGYFLNRNVTFRGDPDARWVSNPGMFATTSLLAGSVDLSLLIALTTADVAPFEAKLLAVSSAGLVRWITYRWILLTEIRRELSVRINRPVADEGARLSVVIPAYNEEERIGETIDTLAAHLSQLPKQLESPESASGPDYELIVVDDCSTDDTATIAETKAVTVVRQASNLGKGAAVRAGVAASTGRAVIFTDADLAYPPTLIDEVLVEIEQGWDMVVGSRRHKQTSTVREQRNVRKLGGWLVNRFTHLVLLGHFRDTQCGLKGFRGDVGRSVFERCLIDGFAFDVELFAIAEQDQLSLKEIPVVVQNRAGSSVSLIGDTAALVRDLIRIRRWVGAGRYRPTGAQQELLDARG